MPSTTSYSVTFNSSSSRSICGLGEPLEAANRHVTAGRMKRSEINAYIKKNWKKLSDQELAIKCKITVSGVEHRRFRMGLKRDQPVRSPREEIEFQSKRERERETRKSEKEKTKYLIKENERLENELDVALSLGNFATTHKIMPHRGAGGEATMIALASDWHLEERVRKSDVNGLNEYNLEIARQRADHFFSTLLQLVKIEQQNTRVDTLILALLGDFITNANLHPEMAHLCLLGPNSALMFAQDCLLSGIEYLLQNSDLKLVFPCHSGNHARTTVDQRHATEADNSLEWIMYRSLAAYFRDEPRVTFIISESYHSYVSVYDWTVRFHHGHDIRYGGGVGGLTIPALKAIAQWNTLRRVDFDCFGHFHTAFDGNSFISNGAMIGYNAYALSVKGTFQEPIQMLFGIHSRLGKYITRSIKFVF